MLHVGCSPHPAALSSALMDRNVTARAIHNKAGSRVFVLAHGL